MITNHSIGNFLPTGSQCFTNHQFTSGIWKLTNGLPLVSVGNDIWASGGGGSGLLNRQNPLSMTKVICRQSLSINRHHNF